MRLFGRCEQDAGKANPMQCEGGINGLGQVKTVNRVVCPPNERVRLDGKFFRLGRPEVLGEGGHLRTLRAPARRRLPPAAATSSRPTSRQIAAMGANTIRVYHVPPRELLDLAHAFGIKVFVDVPWSKHRCFLESPRGHGERPPRRAGGRPRLQGPPGAPRALGRQRDPGRRRALARAGRRSSASSTSSSTSPTRKTRRRSSPSPASRPPSTSTRRRSTSTR